MKVVRAIGQAFEVCHKLTLNTSTTKQPPQINNSNSNVHLTSGHQQFTQASMDTNKSSLVTASVAINSNSTCPPPSLTSQQQSLLRSQLTSAMKFNSPNVVQDVTDVTATTSINSTSTPGSTTPVTVPSTPVKKEQFNNNSSSNNSQSNNQQTTIDSTTSKSSNQIVDSSGVSSGTSVTSSPTYSPNNNVQLTSSEENSPSDVKSSSFLTNCTTGSMGGSMGGSKDPLDLSTTVKISKALRLIEEKIELLSTKVEKIEANQSKLLTLLNTQVKPVKSSTGLTLPQNDSPFSRRSSKVTTSTPNNNCNTSNSSSSPFESLTPVIQSLMSSAATTVSSSNVITTSSTTESSSNNNKSPPSISSPSKENKTHSLPPNSLPSTIESPGKDSGAYSGEKINHHTSSNKLITTLNKLHERAKPTKLHKNKEQVN